MTTPNLGLALAAGPDTIAAALITKFDGNFSTLDTVIGNKVDKGAPITNLITTTAVAGGVPLVAKGILLQSGNLFEARDSTDVVKANITPTGDFYVRGVLLGGAASPLSLISNVATEKPLLIKGFAAQSANLLEVQDSAAAILAQIAANGSIASGPSSTGFSAYTQLGIIARTAGTVGAVLRGFASQTAAILENQNSAGTVLSGFDAAGRLFVATALTSITATAGVNGAPPAQVVGYAHFSDSSGNVRKIPYYAN